VKTADELWLLAARALDEGKVTLEEARVLVGLAEKRVALVDASELRRELELVRARQLEQARAALPPPASEATVEVTPEGTDA
jgi:hypothetical protein